MMKERCVRAVEAAIGRPLKAGESDEITSAIRAQMLALRKQDPAKFAAMTEAQKLAEAANLAAQKLEADAIRKQVLVAKKILAHDRIDEYIKASGHGGFGSLVRLLAFDSDHKSGVQSVESQTRAIRAYGRAKMAEAMDADKGAGWKLFKTKEGQRDIVRELHGQSTGSAPAARIAKAFQEVAEQYRQQFNDNGGNIGHLDDWGAPHHHSQLKVAQVSADEYADFLLSLIKPEKYITPDGQQMTPAEIRDLLVHAHETIATNGELKHEAGTRKGSGARINRGSEHRQIHFKDGDAWLKYQQRFGERMLVDVLFGHIDGMAKDIALVETFGPNPQQMFDYFLGREHQNAIRNDMAKTNEFKTDIKRLKNLFTEVAGTREPPVKQSFANWMTAYRMSNIFGKLGSAAVTAIADQGFLGITASINRLPVIKVLAAELKLLNPANAEHRAQARRIGLATEQMTGGISRWGVDGLASSADLSGRAAQWSAKMAERVLTYSALTAETNAGQSGFGAIMLDSIGSMTRLANTMADIHPDDARLLRSAGITETDWQVFKLADVDDWRGVGDKVLTANNIYDIPDSALQSLAKANNTTPKRLKSKAATRLMGHVLSESTMAIVEAGAKERALMLGNDAAGTAWGEIRRSFWQFKSTPFAMMSRHYRRAAAQPGAGKAKYAMLALLSTTILGAFAMQFNSIAAGREPEDMDNGDFWLRALLKGGGLGIYGDFLLADQTQYGTSFAGIAGGVALGDIEQGYRVAGMLKKALGDDDYSSRELGEDAGAAFARLVKSHTPFANLWYTKAITDHLLFNQIQEFMSPGYLQRSKSRARNEFGTEYWWDPEDVLPE